uniref:Uncharacterized protein n=1 Tax=Leersia perrieri TaxID=77586 RepID=A0A0D9VJQ2_9ORYZ
MDMRPSRCVSDNDDGTLVGGIKAPSSLISAMPLASSDLPGRSLASWLPPPLPTPVTTFCGSSCTRSGSSIVRMSWWWWLSLRASAGSGDGETNPTVTNAMLQRQSGQLEWDLSQVSMHGTWNAWLHLGSRRRLSPSRNSPRQTEQSVLSTNPSPRLYLHTVILLISVSSIPSDSATLHGSWLLELSPSAPPPPLLPWRREPEPRILFRRELKVPQYLDMMV